MASELFHDLYRRAYKLDCAVIHTLNGLTHGMGPGPTTNRAKLAELLNEAGATFIDSIDDFARRNCPRARRIRFACPGCGSPYCGGAVPMLSGLTITMIPLGTIGPDEPESGK